VDLRKICGGEGRYADAEVGVWERDGGLAIIVNERDQFLRGQGEREWLVRKISLQ
jgi:hypothetical protein